MASLLNLNTAKVLFNRFKRGVHFTLVGGGVGAATVLLAPAILPATVVLKGAMFIWGR